MSQSGKPTAVIDAPPQGEEDRSLTHAPAEHGGEHPGHEHEHEHAHEAGEGNDNKARPRIPFVHLSNAAKAKWKRETRFGIAALLSFVILVTVLIVNKNKGHSAAKEAAAPGSHSVALAIPGKKDGGSSESKTEPAASANPETPPSAPSSTGETSNLPPPTPVEGSKGQAPAADAAPAPAPAEPVVTTAAEGDMPPLPPMQPTGATGDSPLPTPPAGPPAGADLPPTSEPPTRAPEPGPAPASESPPSRETTEPPAPAALPEPVTTPPARDALPEPAPVPQNTPQPLDTPLPPAGTPPLEPTGPSVSAPPSEPPPAAPPTASSAPAEPPPAAATTPDPTPDPTPPPARAEDAPSPSRTPPAGNVPATDSTPPVFAVGAGVPIPLASRKASFDDDVPAGDPDDPAPATATKDRDSIEPVPYVVKSGENFYTIAIDHYGYGRYWRALWKANSDIVKAPEDLYVGQTIRIPLPEQLDRGEIDAARVSRSAGKSGDTGRSVRRAAASSATPLALPVADAFAPRAPTSSNRVSDDSSDEAPAVRTRSTHLRHLVRRGETLRSIARDTLGDSHRDREIFELNRDVIDDPNQLAEGQYLELPEDARSARRSR